MNRTVSFLGFLAASLAVAGAVYVYGFRANITQLERTGALQLDQAADRLLGQLAPFQQLPNVLITHPLVTGLFDGSTSVNEANDFLANTALTLGVDAIFVLDPKSEIMAASDFEKPEPEREHNFENAPYVEQAMLGSLGFARGFDAGSRTRKFYFARGVLLEKGAPVGVVVVQVDVAQLEFEWEGGENVLAFIDAADVVFVTNRIELRLNRIGADLWMRGDPRLYEGIVLPRFPEYYPAVGSYWKVVERNEVIPARVVLLSKYMPRTDLTARIFLDVREADVSARIYGLFALALMALIGVGLLALGQRRRRLAERLSVEAAANARLEARVEERTVQLRAAQDQLVQAGKLTALGQMSAGISHELNQPLAAIRNFAQNGVKLIERDRVPEASENLGRIADQVERINRIIKNLRGFARNEREVAEPVDLALVVRDALRLLEVRLRAEECGMTVNGVEAPVMVMGGPVRLQQVIVNLLTNAMDAMAQSDIRQITIDVLWSGKTVELRIGDSGPGLADADRVFEPFYTTKDVGASKGLGLGLSISYGIIGSFGGVLKCRNKEKGGAEFCVTLQSAEATQ